MARPLSYRDRTDPRARAGADTLSRMESDVTQERHYQDQLARQDKQDVRADSRDQRAEESAQLENEARRYALEKQKALDANATRMKIETDKQAIEANDALFKIKTDAPDAHMQLDDWGAKYFRVLDEKTGDPRLIKQFQINQSRADSAVAYRQKRDDKRAEEDAKKAEADAKTAELKANAEQSRKGAKDRGLTESGATIGDDGRLRTTYAAPKQVKASPVEAYQDALAAGRPVYGNGTDPKNFKPTEAGKEAQPHVKVAFQDPSGKPHDLVMERGLFDAMVAASKARRTTPATQVAGDGSVPPTTPPVSTAAPGSDGGDIHEAARAAIKAGANPDMVKERLVKLGGDPSKL